MHFLTIKGSILLMWISTPLEFNGLICNWPKNCQKIAFAIRAYSPTHYSSVQRVSVVPTK